MMVHNWTSSLTALEAERAVAHRLAHNFEPWMKKAMERRLVRKLGSWT